jgi:hypothetical protein
MSPYLRANEMHIAPRVVTLPWFAPLLLVDCNKIYESTHCPRGCIDEISLPRNLVLRIVSDVNEATAV